jgi:hypothetical protein
MNKLARTCNTPSDHSRREPAGRLDVGYRLDFHCLMALLLQLEDPVHAAVFGFGIDASEGLWPYAEAAGFEVRVVERAASGREKRMDALVTRIRRDAYLPGAARKGSHHRWPTATR